MKVNTLPLFASMALLLVVVSCRRTAPAVSFDPAQLPPAPSCAPQVSDQLWYATDEVAPLFGDLGAYRFPVSCTNELAQRYISQGLLLAYGFNHAEAARSFHSAMRLAPDCAMAYWGFAYVLGPNYNAGMESDNYERAYTAIQQAVRLVEDSGSPKEQALIAALAKRYVAQAPDDRTALDIAYADAMRQVRAAFPNDPDIATLSAEALMDLHPWDLWEEDGRPKDWTPEILTGLEAAIALDPIHPGANHLYIHAVEASKQPEKGLSAAKVFDDKTVPGAGHLLHMPSHIYIRTGDYHLGSLANIHAIAADQDYITACRAQGAYPLIYHPHNYHFLVATATLEGHEEWAISAAERMAEQVESELLEDPNWGILQQFYTIHYNTLVKFERWEDILAKDLLDESIVFGAIMQQYARGMAFLASGEAASAQAALNQLIQYAESEELAEIVLGANSVSDLSSIARLVLEGQMAASAGDLHRGMELLEDAIAIEDALNYIEPPDWFFSVRHRLGDLLVSAGEFERAIAVYLQDLQKFPRNGWALHGLLLAYTRLGDDDKAKATEDLLKEVWQTATISLEGSRIRS
ncbi:MAG: hypothetical protein AAF433_12245 [Bacteroidota bacterium]